MLIRHCYADRQKFLRSRSLNLIVRAAVITTLSFAVAPAVLLGRLRAPVPADDRSEVLASFSSSHSDCRTSAVCGIYPLGTSYPAGVDHQ